MRIYDPEDDKALKDIILYLTPPEARQLICYLEGLLEHPKDHHAHLNDSKYQREITVALYTGDNLLAFDERSKRLLIEGE